VRDPSDALKAVSDAMLAVAAQRSVEEVLQHLVHAARDLAGASYAALGTPDGQGGFSRFLVSGMTTQEVAALGPLPRQHGMLGAMLQTAEPYRTADIHGHPRFRGWWPASHPDMHSFLGVPITAGNNVVGAFYLTDKIGSDAFQADDQDVIELLASHAGIAISNARLYERNRELSMLEERNRLALELHDVVSQKLFSLVLTAEAAGTLLERGDPAAAEQITRTQELGREALDELRSLVQELRPADLARDGLAGALTKHVSLQRRLQDVPIELDVTSADVAPERALDVLRIAQEALQNALRHAKARRVRVRMQKVANRLVLEVTDDGLGFDPDDPELRSRRLGLTSMEERAQRVGAALVLDSSPGVGTTVRLELPDG